MDGKSREGNKPMREIKFRGWNKIHKHMTYDLCSSEQRHTLIWGLMQYTGLKDKNGKEIYEGDIIQCHEGGIHFYEDDFDLEVVEWGEFGWHPFESIIGRGRGARDYLGNLNEFIAVGNIYENADLLEVKL